MDATDRVAAAQERLVRPLHRLTTVGLGLGAVLVAGWSTSATATETGTRALVPSTTSLEREQAEEAVAAEPARVAAAAPPAGGSATTQTITVTIGPASRTGP